MVHSLKRPEGGTTHHRKRGLPTNMLRSSAQWLRERFEPQAMRDQDQRHWWQLPDDKTLNRSPWRQLTVDLVTPATFSAWHRKVAESRVKRYDRLRPTVTRAVALAAIAGGGRVHRAAPVVAGRAAGVGRGGSLRVAARG